jgi:hypothetical protein
VGRRPQGPHNLSIAFDAGSTPGVSITKVTFDTSTLGVVVSSPSGGGGIINNGVVNPTFFGALGSSTFGLTATSFPPGANYFNSELNLTLNGNIAINFQGATATVEFSDGLVAKATLSGPISGSNSLGDFVEWESTFSASGGHTPVPEPASLTLLGVGALSLVGYGWRRRRRAAV